MLNQKGFAIIIVPITIVILGLLGTGAVAALEHEKSVSHERDWQRHKDIQLVQDKLAGYFSENNEYPLQKDEGIYGWDVLKDYIEDLPEEPLTDKGWSYAYWSDGLSYTLRYMLEETLEEQVVFGY